MHALDEVKLHSGQSHNDFAIPANSGCLHSNTPATVASYLHTCCTGYSMSVHANKFVCTPPVFQVVTLGIKDRIPERQKAGMIVQYTTPSFTKDVVGGLCVALFYPPCFSHSGIPQFWYPYIFLHFECCILCHFLSSRCVLELERTAEVCSRPVFSSKFKIDLSACVHVNVTHEALDFKWVVSSAS